MSKQQSTDKSATTLKGGPVRFSYAHVFVPTSMNPDDPIKKYSVCLLIPKADKVLVAAIKKAIAAAQEAGKAKWGGKIPAGLRSPLRDGDEEKPESTEYAGMYFMNASATQKPGVVDISRNPLTSEDEFYSGCWGRFHVNFYGYNKAGNKGVGCALNHLQKTRDGERLSGRPDVDSAFDDDWTDSEAETADDDKDLVD